MKSSPQCSPLLSCRRFAVCSLVFMLLASSLSAAVRTWDGSSSGLWSVGANWTGGVAPASGDDLIFPSTATRFNITNNIANLRVRSITFDTGAGYNIYSNAITLTNGISAEQLSPGVNTIFLTITNAGTQNINVANSGALLVLQNLITGSGGLTKSGNGRLLLAGAINNTYTGLTTVNGGILELNDTSGATEMIPGDVLVDLGGTLLLSEGNQIADDAHVTVVGTGGFGTSGLFNLDGFSETIGPLTLTNGGDVSTGAGTLTVGGDINASAGFIISINTPFITGNLSLGNATRTINVADNFNTPIDCSISANISGGAGAGFIKAGGGTLELTGNNTYSGPTIVSNSFVRIASNTALGSAASGTDLRGGHLLLDDATITGESLTNSSGVSLLQSLGTQTNAWNGNVVLNSTLDVLVYTNGLFDLNGVISGAGGMTKGQSGRLRYSGGTDNAYLGNTTVNQGTLELNKSGGAFAITSGLITVGDGVGGVGVDVVRYLLGGQILSLAGVLVNDSGLLDLNGLNDDLGFVTLNGGDVTTGAGTLTIYETLTATSTTNSIASVSGILSMSGETRTVAVNSGNIIPDLQISARIIDGAITKTASGSLRLTASNSFPGLLTVEDGTVILQNSFAAGTTNGGTVVNGNASVQLINDINVGQESLTLNSTGLGLNSAFNDTNSWAGPILLQSDSRVAVQNQGQLTLFGPITGPGRLDKENGGILIFSGAVANSYTNVTTVEAGTLLLNKSVVVGAMAGPLIIGDGTGGADADVVRYVGSLNQLPTATDVLVNSSGLLDFDGANNAIGALSGSGHVELGAGGSPAFNNDGDSSVFDGVITGAGSIRKFGNGTLTLNGNNTYTGPTLASAGELFINGSQPQSHVGVAATGLIGGGGIVGNITNTAGGVVAPGNSPGALTSSNLFFSGAGSDYVMEINGLIPGDNYDLLVPRGTVSLGGSTLNVSVSGDYAPTEGTAYTVISNDGADAIAGTFAGLPQGAIASAGALKFQISYTSGTGNDVALVFTNPPLDLFSAVVRGGNGDGIIDPNECNSLSLAITNTTGGALASITAVLSSPTPHVIITQPGSDYPNLAANGRGTNTTPFQISTLPGFPCGFDIELMLTFSSSAGNFAATFTVPTACGPGGGFCLTCAGVVTNSIAPGDLAMDVRLFRSGGEGTVCGAGSFCPGGFDEIGTLFDIHSFTNTGAETCYTVYLANTCDELFASAYLGNFNTNDICQNYLGDSQYSGSFRKFSFKVPAGSNFAVVVNNIPHEGGGCDYQLVLMGQDCQPSLNIVTVPDNNVRLSWPTSAGGYLLEGTPSLTPTNWNLVGQPPVVTDGKFQVTNNIIGNHRFYRLRKPDIQPEL